MKNEMWKTVGISALTSVVVFFVLYFSIGQAMFSPMTYPTLKPSDLVGSETEINANACNADGVCEISSVIGQVGDFDSIEADDLDVNGLTHLKGDLILNGDFACESCEPMLLRFEVNYNSAAGRAETDVWNADTSELLCEDKVPGAICNIKQYRLSILEVAYSSTVKSVKVSLVSDNGYLVPADTQVKVTGNIDGLTVYESGDMRLLILPK